MNYSNCLLCFLFLTFSSIAYTQESCCDKLRRAGIESYYNGDYEDAIKKWEAAKGCATKCKTDDLDVKIKEAKAKLNPKSKSKIVTPPKKTATNTKPLGVSAEEQKKREAEILRKQQEQADDDAWEFARDIDSEAAYEKYLNKYPDGKYAENAKKMIKDYQGINLIPENLISEFKQTLNDFIFENQEYDSSNGILTPAPSPFCSVNYDLGTSIIKIEYSRPGVKGRTYFGFNGVAPYGKMWRMGANAATKISLSTDVWVQEKLIPAGEYALFGKPGESKWELIFYKYVTKNAGAYDNEKPILIISTKSEVLNNNVENLLFNLESTSSFKAKLSMLYEKTKLSVDELV